MEVVDTVKQLASLCDVYLITVVKDDEDEDKARAALQTFVNVGVNASKLLFCSTATGKSSMVRQLEPTMHIDTDKSILDGLQRYIARLVFVSQDGAGEVSQPHNMYTTSSLQTFFHSERD